ncbi:hypothetical protein BsWGS_09539 [Bradybaena similaris]
MADFEDEVSAGLDQMNPVRDNNTELSDPHLGSEEHSFTKRSDPNMDPLNPFSTQHASLAGADNGHSDHGEELLTHCYSETYAERPQHGQVVYHHDDPADFTNEETRKQIFLDSDQSGDGPFSSASDIGRGDEVDEIVQKNIDSNPFTMEAENSNATVSSGHCVDNNRPGAGYNPFLNDEQDVEIDEEDDHTDDSQEQSDGFPVPGLNGPLGTAGRGDERGVNHTYNLLEEDEEEEVDIQMEPVENIQYPHDEEEEHLAPVADEPPAPNDYGLVGHVEDVSQCSTPRYVEDLSDSSNAQQTGAISGLDVSGHFDVVPESFSRGHTGDGSGLASAEHADDASQNSLMMEGEETSLIVAAGHVDDASQHLLMRECEKTSTTVATGHVDDASQHSLIAECEETSLNFAARNVDDASQHSLIAECEKTSTTVATGQVDDASQHSLMMECEKTSLTISTGQVDNASQHSLMEECEETSLNVVAGHVEDVVMTTSAEYADDMSKIASVENVKESSQNNSSELAQNISQITSTGYEKEDTFKPLMNRQFDDMSPLASTQVVEDKPQVSSMVHAEDMSSFTEKTGGFSQMPSRALFEETSRFSQTDHYDEASEVFSSGVAAEAASCHFRQHDDDLSMGSSGKLPEHMPECPSRDHPEDSIEFASVTHVDVMSQTPSGFIMEMPKCPSVGEHEDTSQSSVGRDVEDVPQSSAGRHVEDMSQISSVSLTEDIPQFSSAGHMEDVTNMSVTRDVENHVHSASGHFNEEISHMSSMEHAEKMSEISSGEHREDMSEIPSEKHAEDLSELSMARDLQDITQAPSTTHAEDISHVSAMKDIENITLGTSSRYLDDLSQLSPTENSEVSSHFAPSYADESIYSRDTAAVFQQSDSVSCNSDLADHHIVSEENAQEKIRLQKDSNSYECLYVETDNNDSTIDTRHEESKADEMDMCPSMGDGRGDVDLEYSNDMIVGEEEEEDEAENAMSKEEVHTESEGHMMDVSDSELVVSDSSFGYIAKLDDDQRDEEEPELVEKGDTVILEQKKEIESGSDEMFIRNSYGISQEKQIGQNEDLRAAQDELKYDDDENEDVGIRDEKGFSSRIDSSIMSSEYEDRSYVDNLSELASPDIIPQPLPSPPEPKDMSSFDPMAHSDTPSPCHEHNGDIGQHGAVYDQAGVVISDENCAPDFLASVEVEGETKFGVDGTAVTSTGQNDAFLHSDEEDEDDDVSQNLDQGGFTTTGTTETETSNDDRSGDFSSRVFEQAENNDNALMSMSMEGSFYDDGGDLMGGDDRKNQQQTHLYEDGYITEESSQHDSYEPKQEHFVVNPDEFGQKVLSVLVQENHQTQQHGHHETQEKDDDFDPLHGGRAPSGSSVADGACDGGNMGNIDSLLEVSVNVQGLQKSNTDHGEKVVHSVEDNIERGFGVPKSDSLVDSHKQEEHKTVDDNTSQGVRMSETVTEKTEKPSAGDAIDKEKIITAPEAAAATAASIAAAGAAGGEAVTKSTTTVKKSSAKPTGKTTTAATTTTATTKVAKETKTANGKAATTTSISKSSPKKQAESRPTSVATTERKSSAKAAGSPTKSATPPATKTTAPLPSYAQPIAHRKPREAKILSPEEKKKKVATATSVTRASSATPHPRPQSVNTAMGSVTATTSARTTTRSASTVASSASRTAQLARPKSSPTKLTNGIASPCTEGGRSPTTKTETDSKKEEHRPRSGKKEHKITSKVDAGVKSATTPTTSVAKSPTKQATPLTLASPKTGEVKSKIGSLENATHTPGGGHIKITHKKPNYTNVSSKIGSKDNMDYKPGGGHVKIENRKIKVEAKSKVGSLENAAHKPGGGDKKIEVQKTEWKAQSKIGSLDNAKHKPGVGDKQTNGSDVDDKTLKNGLAENTGPASVSEHGATELLNGSASEI